jgi:hypothetical protein
MPTAPGLTPLQSLAPQHWPSWAAVGILRLLELLPYPAMLMLGRGLGFIARGLVPKYRRIASQSCPVPARFAFGGARGPVGEAFRRAGRVLVRIGHELVEFR